MSNDTVPMAIAVAWRIKKLPVLGRAVSIGNKRFQLFFVLTIMAFVAPPKEILRPLPAENSHFSDAVAPGLYRFRFANIKRSNIEKNDMP